jgi:Uma2 family endonuclease
MTTAPTGTRVTAEELLAMPGLGRCELLEGVVRTTSPPGAEHGMIAAEVASLLREYALEHGGRAFGETGFVLARDPDTVRAPDVAYVTPAHAARVGRIAAYWPGAPDLAVEVVSPNDSYTEVHEKALGWLAAGASVVLVVDPAARHVTRYRSAADVVVLAVEEVVDCKPAMPGFSPLAKSLLLLD